MMLSPAPMFAIAAPAHSDPIAWHGVRCNLPTGWKRSVRDDQLWLTPPDARAALAVILLPERSSTGEFAAAFDAFVRGRVFSGETLAREDAAQPFTSAQGIAGRRRTLAVRDAAGKTAVRLYVGVPTGDTMQLLAVVTTDPALLEKHAQEVAEILKSWSFERTPGAPAKRASTPAPTSALPAGAIRRGAFLNVGPFDPARAGLFVQDVALDCVGGTLLVACARPDNRAAGGIYRSVDGGKSWRRTLSEPCQQVAPTGTGRVYALGYLDGRLYRSDDRGASWTRLPSPTFALAGTETAADLTGIAASPAQPDTLYASARGVSGAGLYKSIDGGKRWTRPTISAQIAYQGERLDVHETECAHLVVDPEDENLVFAFFNHRPCKSSDGGRTFFDAIAFPEGSGPAQRRSLPLRVVHPGAFAFDPAQPQYGYLRCTENFQDTLYRTGSGGRGWTKLTVPAGSVYTVALCPGQPQIVYITTERGLFVSNDAGARWSPVEAGEAPRPVGSFEIPAVFTGTAFPGVGLVSRANEPVVVDPQTGRLVYGTATGLKLLVPVR